MRTRGRGTVLGIGLAGTATTMLAALSGLSSVGRSASLYGDTINRVAPIERKVADTVAAVTFDYRGFDTLGEESILFAAVLSVVVLLRDRKGAAKSDDERPGRPGQPQSEAVRSVALAVMGATVVFGLYLITHGQLTPGGGFQGGVVLSTAPMLAYLAARPTVLQAIAPEALVRVGEALALGGYILLGAAAVFRGRAFLTNILPLGRRGDVASSGTILALNVLTGVAVAAGFILLLTAFLEKARQNGGDRQEDA